MTGVLNANLGRGWYETKEMPNDPPTQGQRDLLWNDIVLDIDNNYPLVANIVAPPGNQPPGYPSDQTIYHYFTVFGYDDGEPHRPHRRPRLLRRQPDLLALLRPARHADPAEGLLRLIRSPAGCRAGPARRQAALPGHRREGGRIPARVLRKAFPVRRAS